MLSCVQRAFLSDSSAYVVTRSAAGHYSEGRWEAGTTSTLSVDGVLEPMTNPAEILRLEDARHVKAAFKFYTLTELRIVSPDESTQPDVMTISGDEYEVEGVSDWSEHGGGYKVIVVRRESQAHDAG